MDIEAAVKALGWAAGDGGAHAEQMRDDLRAAIEAAFPWRALTEDVVRNVTLQARLPGDEAFKRSRIIQVYDKNGFTFVRDASIGLFYSNDPFWPVMDSQEWGLRRLIERGAEVRDMLP